MTVTNQGIEFGLNCKHSVYGRQTL